MDKPKIKYAFAGASGRGLNCYGIPLHSAYSQVAELVGIYDINHARAEVFAEKSGGIPVYSGFDEMLMDSKPDIVIVTTVDRYHHEYIIKALDAGCGVISEKPLTIDAEKANEIIAAEKRNGRKVRVIFNLRCAPFSARIKQLLNEGFVGDVYSVHFEWMLDTSHGADYFRRWHRRLENSGGLLVHKSTHHFDFVNWLIGDEPEAVSAFGTRRFYGTDKEKRNLRCLTCAHKAECEFYLDIEANSLMKELYLDCEGEDGYFRDKCVFSDEIDIFDTVSLGVKYSRGTVMSYSLTAHSPYEGYKMNINGEKGRLEIECFSGTIGPFAGKTIQNIRFYNRLGEIMNIEVPVDLREHGGGDDVLRALLFGEKPDCLKQLADSRAGVMSLIIGAAANKSIAEKKTQLVKDLINMEELE